MSTRNQLTIQLPGGRQVKYDLDAFHKQELYMGRGLYHGDQQSVPNDIQVGNDVTSVSRRHCILRRDERGQWTIIDDHSMNGLCFQGKNIQSHSLHHGDILLIGNAQETQVILFFSSQETGNVPQNDDYVDTSELGSVEETYSLKNLKECWIGRSKECNVVVSHPTASRRHCVITKENGTFYITDNNSRNGVILNSQSLDKKTRLNPMDRITIADTTFVFSDNALLAYKLTGGVSVTARNVSKKVKSGFRSREKLILQNVTLSIEPNQFVGIIGGSGAGKTTVMNCLSGMDGFTSGEVLINGESIRASAKNLKSLMGYVPQQDIVYDSLTLERMLYYSAKLRMPRDTSKEEIQRKIKETLDIVELSEHRKTMIGKLSGGERKRASIAVELLASPKLFFLDEPSSGLDPGTEKHLMQMLKHLSESGRTVIMVTHTVQNLALCDQVICMGRGGRLCFAGAPQEALNFFHKRDLADIYDDLNDNSKETAERFALYAQRNAQEHDEIQYSEKRKRKFKSPRTLLHECAVMTQRYAEILYNNRSRLALLFLMPAFLTLLVCMAFEADGNLTNLFFGNTASLRKSFPFLVATDTMSLMFSFSCAAFWVGIFNSIQEISKERTIYERDKFSGISSMPYVFSKFTPLTMLCLIQSVIMTALLIQMTTTFATGNGDITAASALNLGMKSDGIVLGEGLMWLETFLTTFLCVLSAMCLGLMISTLVSNDMALVLCPVCLIPQILFSGVVGELRGVTEMISNITACRWSCLAYFVSADINELYKSCSYEVGRFVTKTLSEDGGTGVIDSAYYPMTEYLGSLNGVESAWVILLIMSAVCVTAAALILRFKRRKVR